MFYYDHNIPDYKADTAHLGIVEHGIYRTLMDWYYYDEKPIPLETQVVMRRLSLESQWLHLLTNVLNDFFIKGENGYYHNRIEAELAHYHAKAARNRVNGNLGGRPKKTQVVSNKNQVATQNNPTVTLTNNKELITNNKHTDQIPVEQDVVPDKHFGGRVCFELNKLQIQGLNPSNPTFKKLIDAGATMAEFVDTANTITVKKFSYLLTVVAANRDKARAEKFATGVYESKLWTQGGQPLLDKAKELKIGTQGLTDFQLKAKISAKLDELKRTESGLEPIKKIEARNDIEKVKTPSYQPKTKLIDALKP